MHVRLRTAVSATSAALVAAATLGTAPSASSAGDDDLLLGRPAQGAMAVRTLGADLAAVAAINDMTAEELEGLLLQDGSVWVHPDGLLYYVDALHDVGDAPVAAKAPYPYSETFQLHSNPGSLRTIYLDFNGEYVGGTAWNDIPDYQLTAQTHPAFDLDGDPTTFSNVEQDAIQSIWQRVGEDFAPFDVDVTTADPGLAALRRTDPSDLAYGTRALVTPSRPAASRLCNSSCGGVAFMGTYDMPGTDLGAAGSDYAQPAWVFPHLLTNDTKAIAEAVSHEVGHNVGLDHDGTATIGYFGGHNAWAPIMGNSYRRPISQWSAGEYSGATLPSRSPQQNADDLTVITQNGMSFLADDHGNGTGTATPVSAPSPVDGLITTRTDKDYFAFPQSCSGHVTISVAPAPTSPNLDVRLRVLRGDGTVLAVANPASAPVGSDAVTGMDASATVPATDGATVYAEVDGVGAGNPATDGYSDYASLGRFTITSTECTPVISAQPDLLVSPKPRRGYVGNDVYNATGADQSKQVSAQRGEVRSFFARLTNDGSTAVRFTLTARQAPKGSRITYLDDGVDLTDLLTGGRSVDIAPDQSALVEVRIKIGRRARIGSLKAAVLTAVSDAGGQLDVVKAAVKVTR